jgi:mycothiol synthase
VREAGPVSTTTTIRAATVEDVDAILDLSLLCDIAEIGEANTTIDEITSDVSTEGFVGGVIDGPDGGLAGYVWVERQPGHQTVYGDYALRPGADPALAQLMLDWFRAQGHELGPGLAPHAFADTKNPAKCRIYEAAGGVVIRRFYRMGITFDGVPPTGVPVLGDGVIVRSIDRTEDDLRAMHAVVDVAFLDHFNHEPYSYEKWLEGSLEGFCPDISLWWLATVAGEPAAGLYGSLLPAAGYVDTLGTLRAYRGKGLARALLLTAFNEFYRRGLPKVVLGVDAENPTGALALYESAGMTAEHEGLRYQLPALS